MFEKFCVILGGLSLVLGLVAVDLCFIGLFEFAYIEVLSLCLVANARNVMKGEHGFLEVEEVVYEEEEWND